MQCPNCNGNGCIHCVHGYLDVSGCPNEFCRDISASIPMIDLFDKGLPPVSGGVLDQAAWFVDAVNTLHREESMIKAENQ